jgi:hypothetical protein
MLTKILIGLTILGIAMNTSSASDYLAPSASVQVSFTVSEKVNSENVSASITLSAAGLQRLMPDGLLAVNGVVMQAKKLEKQGFWYQDYLPRAGIYELVIRRAKATPDEKFVLRPRKFIPEMPRSIAKTADLNVRFDGAPLKQGEKLFIKVTSADSVPPMLRWRSILKGVVDGDQIRIPSAALANCVVGEALLSISLLAPQPLLGTGDDLTYVVGNETRVVVTD